MSKKSCRGSFFLACHWTWICPSECWLKNYLNGLLIVPVSSVSRLLFAVLSLLFLLDSNTYLHRERVWYSCSRRRVQHSCFQLQGSYPQCIMQIADKEKLTVRNHSTVWIEGLQGLLHINNEGWAAALTCFGSISGGFIQRVGAGALRFHVGRQVVRSVHVSFSAFNKSCTHTVQNDKMKKEWPNIFMLLWWTAP